MEFKSLLLMYVRIRGQKKWCIRVHDKSTSNQKLSTLSFDTFCKCSKPTKMAV
jgi:hypothetical protein